ncbi:hypothetical protein HHI36_009268 [Cryptolaemus montrouzieri]|uniref:Lipase domain-containing protein n=1 Tax=Cryptolaemus montrouzieri TaxID=559131 RepID=A0ABD2MV76_9CUCU
MKELYNTTTLVANKQCRSKKPIDDKHRNPLVNAIGQVRRWQECLRELFQNEILDGVDQPTDEEDEDVTENSRNSTQHNESNLTTPEEENQTSNLPNQRQVCSSVRVPDMESNKTHSETANHYKLQSEENPKHPMANEEPIESVSNDRFYLLSAYLSREDYNILTVDWKPLSRFPCYLSALSNTKLVAQCTAKLYAFMMDNGAAAEDTTCVGHSLGAHICGMISNHLNIKQHRIIGLDPARPLIDRYADNVWMLTRDDAHQVQIIHTNAGFLGEIDQIGHVDFCVNGGRIQPGCRGHRLRIARCSHFQSACYFANTVFRANSSIGYPCSSRCPKTNNDWGILPGNSIPMGEDTPYGARGMYCVTAKSTEECPFN